MLKVSRSFLFRQIRLRRTCVRSFSETSKPIVPKRWHIWNNIYFRGFFRVARTVVILSSLGATAYSLGQMDYIEDPTGFEEKALKSLLLQLKCNRVVIAGENDRINRLRVLNVMTGQTELSTSDELIKAAEISLKVLNRIKKSAIQELDDILSKMEAEMLGDSNTAEPGLLSYGAYTVEHDTTLSPVQFSLMKDEYELFLMKRKALDKPWSVVILDEETPNAFVNGFLPNKIFISTGVLKHFTKDESQLGLVMAHEMSHYVLGHAKHKLLFDAVMKVVVVSIISLFDVSGGLASFLPELMLPYVGTLLGRGYNREQELEADKLGLKICTRGCFKPERSVQLFPNMEGYMKRMGEVSLLHKLNQSTVPSVLSTHPMNKERFENTLKVLGEHKQLYTDFGCNEGLIKKFYTYVLGGKRNASEKALLSEDAISQSTGETPEEIQSLAEQESL